MAAAPGAVLAAGSREISRYTGVHREPKSAPVWNRDGSFQLTRRRKEEREEMTTIRKVFVLLVVVAGLAVFANPSQAQDRRVEITPFVGYTLSEGIKVDPNSIVNIVVDEISPTSGLSYGLNRPGFSGDCFS